MWPWGARESRLSLFPTGATAASGKETRVGITQSPSSMASRRGRGGVLTQLQKVLECIDVPGGKGSRAQRKGLGGRRQSTQHQEHRLGLTSAAEPESPLWAFQRPVAAGSPTVLTHYSLVGQPPREGTKGTATSLGQVPVGCPAGGALHAPRRPCQVPITAATTRRRLRALTSLWFWTPEFQCGLTGPKPRCRRDWVPSGRSRGNLLSCLLQLLEAGPDPWLM